MAKLSTLAKLVGVSLVGSLLAGQIPYKNMLLNIMSNRPDNLTLSWSLRNIVKHSTTRGHYDGVRPGATEGSGTELKTEIWRNGEPSHFSFSCC